jgi:hypothetical protein
MERYADKSSSITAAQMKSLVELPTCEFIMHLQYTYPQCANRICFIFQVAADPIYTIIKVLRLAKQWSVSKRFETAFNAFY